MASQPRAHAAEERPTFVAFDPDAVCAQRRYTDEHLPWVLQQVERETSALVAVLTGLPEAAWQRVGLGGDGGERTILTLTRRAAHEVHHHTHDIALVLRP